MKPTPEHIELGWNPTPGMVSVAISELRRKIAALEQRIAALEKPPEVPGR